MSDIPTVNVNLAPCDCDATLRVIRKGNHRPKCASLPILVPLSLEPWRSVTVTVALGECNCTIPSWWTATATEHAAAERRLGREWTCTSGCACGPCRAARKAGWLPGQHNAQCPARPIRVTCSISGKTWEESEVTDLDVPGRIAGTNAVADLWRICRERWALVKALVTGQEVNHPAPAKAQALSVQRDAVFAALADLAQIEEAAYARVARLRTDIPESADWATGAQPRQRDEMATSTLMLAAYVERLISQIGSLPRRPSRHSF